MFSCDVVKKKITIKMNKKREKIGRCFFHSKGAIERRKVNEELNKSIFLLNYQKINK